MFRDTGKSVFKLPYAGIDHYFGLDLLYGENGDFSVVFQITNPVLQYAADQNGYAAFHMLFANLIRIVGEGFILQKQDVLITKEFSDIYSNEFLQLKYAEHFKGRRYTTIATYLVLTRQVKRGSFYVYDKRALAEFQQLVYKVLDLLQGGGFRPVLLGKTQISRYISSLISMEFASGNLAMDNMSCTDQELKLGSRSIRSISLINTDVMDLPEQVSSYRLFQLGKGNGLRDFPMDNFSFLHQVPGVEVLVYNQVIQVPHQQMTIGKLELKRKRHSGVPDPANNLCVEDIDRLLVDVARENQLLVNAHYNILVCAQGDKIAKAANFIEASLFQQGITPSRNAYNQLELFRTVLPGNSVELKNYDWFLTTSDAALCLLFKESLLQDEKSDYLIRFTDRQGIPVAIDPSDLSMRTGRINSRSRFILGPSGSGKSFFVNSLVEQYLLYNMDVVIIDTGHSYSGLCAYKKGKYITYSEASPITMNPFVFLESEYNIEKKDFICTLIGLCWKGADGILNPVERDVISSVISGYYSSYFGGEKLVKELKFDSFYDFAVTKIPEIKASERIAFDFQEFKYVLKKFYKGGEFAALLNEKADASLFTAPFIVFEIDSIKEHKILFPLVTLIIMDVFIQKMRGRNNRRKALIVEEAWKAVSSPLMAGTLVYLYKTVRKFFGEVIVVTQELGDIIGNAIVKDSIISNSDTIILLDQSKFKDNYDQVSALLSISETERKKIFTINQLDNRQDRGFFKEVYIRRGAVGEVYGVEVSLHQYLCYTTEKPEKTAVEHYVELADSYQQGLEDFVQDFKESGLALNAFVTRVNNFT